VVPRQKVVLAVYAVAHWAVRVVAVALARVRGLVPACCGLCAVFYDFVEGGAAGVDAVDVVL